MQQRIITPDDHYAALDAWLRECGDRAVLLVGNRSIDLQKRFTEHLDALKRGGVRIVEFRDFQANPRYESVVKGVELFHREDCGAIIAVGGGSAMDVAKCIKLFSNMDEDKNYLEQPIVANDVPFLAMPTTAGTGSEVTRYAIIYYQGNKQSVTHESCIPGTVLMDPDCLKTLPAYQKKATMLDALCHAMESLWSVSSTEESMGFAREAIEMVMAHMEGYLNNTDEGNRGMLMASNLAGKAINITGTTAGHAMCYKITTLYGAAHGHATMLCNRVLLPWIIEHTDSCTDPRGEAHLNSALDQLARALGCETPREASDRLNDLFDRLELEVPVAREEDYALLRQSVNLSRLKNHPVAMDGDTIDLLYHRILK